MALNPREAGARFEVQCDGETVCWAHTLVDALTDAHEVDPTAGLVTIADHETEMLVLGWWLL